MPRRDIRFELLHQDPSGARRSRYQTTHGVVECPTFMPVGTVGAVKAVTPHQVAQTGAQVVLANTFHMSLGERLQMVVRGGGLHKIMAWDQTILTDSGGFQVFSLPDVQIQEAGVTFTYKDEEEPIEMSPESSMAIQRDLGADIAMAFDECVGFPSTREYVERSVARTTRWAARCLSIELAPHQFLFGIVQGGIYDDLRRRSAAEITALPFDGFAIGGASVGEGFELLDRIVSVTAPCLPEHLPRYLMGVGRPEDLFLAVERGMDMFDCVIPTRYARGGTLFTRVGRIRIGDKRYRKDRYPIDSRCGCYTCQHFSRLVLRHLYYAREPLYLTLASIHNLQLYQDLMAGMREAIEADRFARFKGDWLAAYTRRRG